jgi:hypothetical protein
MNPKASTDAIRAHLCACEEALLDPAVRRDRARVAALLAEDFREFGSSGTVWLREQILDLLASEDYQPPAMEDFKCELIAEGVALVTYQTARIDPQTGHSATVLRSSIWIEESGVWRVRFHQGTRQGTKQGREQGTEAS